MDIVRVVLIIGNIIFLILSVTFIILFATKHDSSSGFFLTTPSLLFKSNDEFRNALNSRLTSKYSVGSLATEFSPSFATAVFSLRGSQSLQDVQSYVAGSDSLKLANVTEGSKALEVCAAVHPDVYIPCTTQAPPATANPATYCNGFLNRDIVLLVDTLVSPMKDDKQAALKQVGAALATGIPFGTGVRVAIVTLNGAMKVSDFVSNAASFNTAWATLLALPFTSTEASIDVQPAYDVVKSLLSQQTPMEAIIISDHPLGAIDPPNDIRLKGVFVSAVVPTNVNLFGYDKLTTVKKVFPTWSAMAIVNPFSTLLCQYSDAPPAAPKALLLESAQAATDDTPKCQKLDIIVVFDTSQSVVEPFIKKYVDFSKKFIAQYTLSGAVDGDNTRTGIISFSSDVKIVRNLGERPVSDFNAAVDGIHYTGGTTNTLAAMKAGRDMFKNSGGTTHGRTMVFLSDGQPYPLTPDTWTEIISVGSELKQMGVDIFFVGDDNGYDSDTRTVLSNITGNTNWVFNTTSDAMVNLTADLVVEFPCPPLICEMAYYAVELSEILSEQAKVQSLSFILQTAQNVYTAKNTTQFQLMVYNDMQYLLPNDGNYSFENFKSVLNSLINNSTYRGSFSSGHTRIDTAFDFLTREMNIQQLRRPFFQSSVLFAGQANSGVLDPLGDENTQISDLKTSVKNMQLVCPLIYVLDNSKGNTQVYGDDLWSQVVPSARTITLASNNLEKDLENTDYYPKLQALDCKLPAEAQCNLNFIDMIVAFDLVSAKSTNVTNYVNTLLGQFNTIYTAHISMMAYGSGNKAADLLPLAAHDDMSQGFINLEKWNNGTFFTTTAPSTTTTVAMSTSKAPITKAPTTKAPSPSPSPTRGPSPTVPTTQPAPEDEMLAVNTPITSDDIDSLFSLIETQFGCGSYSDDADRPMVPNVVLIVSDNLASYTNVWKEFQTDGKMGWECSDCPANPSYVFLSATADAAPKEIGVTYTLTDSDFGLDSSMKAMNLFNSIVDGLCNTQLRACCSYAVPMSCQRRSFWN
ncbi:hypothetical protein V3C99_013230 [Haemonchus contortus]